MNTLWRIHCMGRADTSDAADATDATGTVGVARCSGCGGMTTLPQICCGFFCKIKLNIL